MTHSQPGSVFGRYVILERIGKGGMGIVYKAYDPELDRRVALKLVRVDGPVGDDAATRATELRERLLREAQAMARLSHPNVIAVHDVGSLGNDVFVAMELVDGPTLTTWLRESPRRAREILAVFIQAAHGLAAAHRAGLVHRDFKPDNCIVGRDGRVRVLDFGLARAHDDGAGSPRPDGAPGPDDSDLTRTGAAVGTPAYMSPEQHLGEPTDPRSDQFSFCVALYLALVGSRPFPGSSADEISHAVTHGNLREPPLGKMRRSLWRKLRRGLATRPADRFPTMEALIVALGRSPDRLIMPGLAAMGGVSLVAAAVVLLRPPPSPCATADGHLGGVWDEGRRADVERAFKATGVPFAEEAFVATRARLDEQAARLTAMRRDACEATRVRGEQSDELFDLRVACLDERVGELGALVDLFAGADRGIVERAPVAASGLSPVAICADARWLNQRVRPPLDPATRARTEALQRQLAAVEAQQLAGRFAAALEAGKKLVAPAALLGHRPTEARVLLALGRLTQRVGDPRAAIDLLLQAQRAAFAGRDARLAAVVDLELARNLGRELRDAERGLAYAGEAEGLLEGEGGDRGIEARLAQVRGQVLIGAGRDEEATADLLRSVALFEGAGPDEAVNLAGALNDLGGNFRSLGRYPEARVMLERALALRQQTLGPSHPFVASTWFNLGNLAYSQGRYAEAQPLYQRALDIRERSLGPEHPYVAESLSSMAQNLDAMGEPAAALAAATRALQICEKVYGPDHLNCASGHNIAGDIQRSFGHFTEARAAYDHALAIKEKALGPDHADLAVTIYSIGDVLRAQRRFTEALQQYERAMKIDLAAHGESLELAFDLTAVGAVLIELGQPAAAIAPLSRARRLRARPGANPNDVAETDFALARAFGRNRPEALELARAARAAYQAAGKAAEVAAIEAWLGSPRTTQR